MYLRILVLFSAFIYEAQCIEYELFSYGNRSKLELNLVKDDGLSIKLSIGNETKLSGHIGRNRTIEKGICTRNICSFSGNDSDLLIFAEEDHFEIIWAPNPNISLSDCYDLNSTNVSWYGGPEVLVTSWPIENLTMKNRPYISSKLDNGAVVEPYWLNSKGGFILIDHTVPLFVDQNHDQRDKVCFKSNNSSPFAVELETNFLVYKLGAGNNSRSAHLFVVNEFLGKPSALPASRMVKYPIWTTWGKYKAEINDNTVTEFFRNIYYHNFTKGQIEIDDKWEVCYGDQTFDNKTKFSKINETIAAIHEHGFKATIWTHPFVNTDCRTPVNEGIRNGYFVNSSTGNSVTSWWNGNSSYVIDFTNPTAADWFKNRLLKLKEYGIDGYKCDAGENDWLPEKPIFNTTHSDSPNSFTRLYLEACAELGDLVEVRSGYRTQNLSIFVRMLDKDSVWGTNNGLKALVHSLLQFNMIGYTYVLPDLVGGNGYNGTVPSPELLVRWTQANTFMPSLQFSYLPWEIGLAPFNTTEIVRKYVDLHEQYADVIIDAMRNSSDVGTPVNPPIWWIDPNDQIALKVDDEFLVGEKILVAPVLDEGKVSRDVYLPKGRWRDGNTNQIYAGGRTLKDYSAPIDILPYFIRL